MIFLYVIVGFIVMSIIALDVTMVQFLAVMRLREMRDLKIITPSKTPFLWAYAMLVIIRGLLCDLWVQLFVCTVVGLELPPVYWHRTKSGIPYFTIEWLTTSRLIRWNKEPSKGWWTVHVKKKFVAFGKMMLDPSDTTGKHII